MKDPAVLFYTSDFLTGTSRLTDEQVGQYARALFNQHQEGHFTKDELFMFLKSYDSPVWKKFKQDENGLFYNERMDEEIEKRLIYCKSKSHPGKSGRKNKSYENHMNTDRESYGNHTENENENDNIDNKKRGKGEKQIFVQPSIEEVISYCTERNRGVDPVKWFNFYSAKGWMIGKNKMKNWKAAIHTWEKEIHNTGF